MTREDFRVEVGFELGLTGKHNADPSKEKGFWMWRMLWAKAPQICTVLLYVGHA